jgi:hypothetical protein
MYKWLYNRWGITIIIVREKINYELVYVCKLNVYFRDFLIKIIWLNCNLDFLYYFIKESINLILYNILINIILWINKKIIMDSYPYSTV